jgi:hypothetical protein
MRRNCDCAWYTLTANNGSNRDFACGGGANEPPAWLYVTDHQFTKDSTCQASNHDSTGITLPAFPAAPMYQH